MAHVGRGHLEFDLVPEFRFRGYVRRRGDGFEAAFARTACGVADVGRAFRGGGRELRVFEQFAAERFDESHGEVVREGLVLGGAARRHAFGFVVGRVDVARRPAGSPRGEQLRDFRAARAFGFFAFAPRERALGHVGQAAAVGRGLGEPAFPGHALDRGAVLLRRRDELVLGPVGQLLADRFALGLEAQFPARGFGDVFCSVRVVDREHAVVVDGARCEVTDVGFCEFRFDVAEARADRRRRGRGLDAGARAGFGGHRDGAGAVAEGVFGGAAVGVDQGGQRDRGRGRFRGREFVDDRRPGRFGREHGHAPGARVGDVDGFRFPVDEEAGAGDEIAAADRLHRFGARVELGDGRAVVEVDVARHGFDGQTRGVRRVERFDERDADEFFAFGFGLLLAHDGRRFAAFQFVGDVEAAEAGRRGVDGEARAFFAAGFRFDEFGRFVFRVPGEAVEVFFVVDPHFAVGADGDAVGFFEFFAFPGPELAEQFSGRRVLVELGVFGFDFVAVDFFFEGGHGFHVHVAVVGAAGVVDRDRAGAVKRAFTLAGEARFAAAGAELDFLFAVRDAEAPGRDEFVRRVEAHDPVVAGVHHVHVTGGFVDRHPARFLELAVAAAGQAEVCASLNSWPRCLRAEAEDAARSRRQAEPSSAHSARRAVETRLPLCDLDGPDCFPHSRSLSRPPSRGSLLGGFRLSSSNRRVPTHLATREGSRVSQPMVECCSWRWGPRPELARRRNGTPRNRPLTSVGPEGPTPCFNFLADRSHRERGQTARGRAS